ncbi:MAG: DUF2254 domain-containing protein [Verrucomicrobiota bacterium]|nr:DUF2254 domain-containing protein [Verrucomicrobiota bacterium]
MLRKWWIEVRSSLWFVPSLLVIAALVAAFGLIKVDANFDHRLNAKVFALILGASAQGARSMLAAIATSMITVAGDAFSITIVTLSLASTQYTPRILRNFMRDTANQAVLGAFVSIFAYCLIVLRSIRSPDEGSTFVPLFAVFFGVLLALLSIGCLIFFIHHVAASIQASTILSVIAKDTAETIEHLFPDQLPTESSELAPVVPEEFAWQPVNAPANGYIQAIDRDGLHRAVSDEGLVVRLESIAGEFVVKGAPLMFVHRAIEKRVGDRLRSLYVIGDFRTLEQDANFGFRQIVDIALKALSPGVNDTNTAVNCLDYLSALLLQLAGRKIESSLPMEDGQTRIFAPSVTFDEFVAKAFDEIRLAALANVTILLQIARVIGRVASATHDAERRRVLVEQLRLALEAADHSVPAPYDRARIDKERVRVLLLLASGEHAVPALASTRTSGTW